MSPVPSPIVFSPGAIIYAGQHNTNNSNFKTWGDAHETTSTGIHGVGVGSIMGTQQVNSLSASGRITGTVADYLILPNLAPTVDRSIALVDRHIELFDSNFGGKTLRVFPGETDQNGGAIYNGYLVNDGVNKQLRLVNETTGLSPTSSNPVFVRLPSNAVPGAWIILKITSAKLFDYKGAADSDIIGEEFGTTAGTAWSSDRPFAIYGINKDDTDAGVELAISPNPNAINSPATTNIGWLDNPAATPSDNNFFFWTSTNPSVTHTLKPAAYLGNIRMVKDASDDWTVQTFGITGDGFGSSFWFGGFDFTFPLGQMGAAAGTMMKANGGTAPVFTTNDLTYRINRQGGVTYKVYADGDGGTDGAGAVSALLAAPYGCIDTRQGKNESMFYMKNNATFEQHCGFFFTAATSIGIQVNSSTTAVTTVLNSNFPNGARTISGTMFYGAF